MKKIILIAAVLALAVALTGCGNENLWVGNYTFKHVHFSDGVEGKCAEVTSWHDNELGCEVHTPAGGIYLSEGTYQLFENEKVCPYCGKEGK